VKKAEIKHLPSLFHLPRLNNLNAPKEIVFFKHTKGLKDLNFFR